MGEGFGRRDSLLRRTAAETIVHEDGIALLESMLCEVVLFWFISGVPVRASRCDAMRSEDDRLRLFRALLGGAEGSCNGICSIDLGRCS